jgi:hypothetical protein
MSQIIGRDIQAGVSVESVRGTAKTTVEKWIKNVSAYIVEKAENVVEDSKRGVLEDSLNRRVVKKWIEGTLEGIAQADAIGYLFYNLFGGVSSTGSSVYTHVFNLAQSVSHATLSLFVKKGAVEQNVYNGGMIGKLTLSATIDDYVRFSADFMAKLGASNSASPSYGTEYDFIGKDITIKTASSEAGLAGATATKIKSLDIEFNTGLIVDHILGSYTPDDILNGKLSIEGSFKKNHIDTTFKTLYEGDTSQYMSITIEGSADIGTGNHPTITILLTKAMVMDWTISGGADELVEEEIKFKGFYNTTDSKACQVTLKNLTSEYATPPSA